MTTATLDVKTHAFDVEDIEYLRQGDKPLLARVFRPRGEGPFPALVVSSARPATTKGCRVVQWQCGGRSALSALIFSVGPLLAASAVAINRHNLVCCATIGRQLDTRKSSRADRRSCVAD
jgi:hypothetical protein